MEYNKITEGYFTTAGVAKTIVLPYLPKKFSLINKTQWGSTSATAQVKAAIGFPEDAAGTAYLTKNTSSAATDESITITSGGFTFVTADTPTYGAVFTITGITQANPASVTTSAPHGYVTGDTVLIYGTTGMLQVAGVPYVITVTGATTFTIPVNSSGFAAAATAGFVKKILYPDLYIPLNAVITAITKAASAVVTTSVAHNMVVGQEVYFNVPVGWGMTEISGKKGYVSAVTSNTLTVEIDSSGFTTFAYPTSAVASLGITFPQVVPIGDRNTGFQNSSPTPQNYIPGAFIANTRYAVIIGTGIILNSSDVIRWEAVYPDQFIIG